MRADVIRAGVFAREGLRAPFVLVMLIVTPALFVFTAAGALSEFAAALGGALGGDAAVALSAGWAAALVSGLLGFFQAASSRSADRRLIVAGLPAARVALSRVAASAALAVIAAATAFAALELRAPAAHPWHAAAAVLAFAALYLAIGVIVGSVVTAPLEGSLVVVFVFLLDAFAGPGMSGSPAVWAVSRRAADTLIAAGAGGGVSGAEVMGLVITVAASIGAALIVFTLSARRRS